MLNLGRLHVLREVVNRGSFSAAADALSYTQSAVSQAIARLEAETGAPHSGARGWPKKSTAKIVCGCSAQDISRLVEYPSKQVKPTYFALRSAPARCNTSLSFGPDQ